MMELDFHFVESPVAYSGSLALLPPTATQFVAEVHVMAFHTPPLPKDCPRLITLNDAADQVEGLPVTMRGTSIPVPGSSQPAAAQKVAVGQLMEVSLHIP